MRPKLINIKNVKIAVNGNTLNMIHCSTCGNDIFNAESIFKNCETGYIEFQTKCTCCGKIDIYDYRYAIKKFNLINCDDESIE